MDNHALWKSNKKGVEKLDGGEQDVKGLVALAGELGPPEGAHCEGRPTQEVNKMAELFKENFTCTKISRYLFQERN